MVYYLTRLMRKGRGDDVAQWSDIREAKQYIDGRGVSFAYPENSFRFQLIKADDATHKTRIISKGTKKVIAGPRGPLVRPRFPQANPTAGAQYKPEKRGDSWYVAAYDLATKKRRAFGGMNTSFTTRAEALRYANQINRANRYPLANPNLSTLGTTPISLGLLKTLAADVRRRGQISGEQYRGNGRKKPTRDSQMRLADRAITERMKPDRAAVDLRRALRREFVNGFTEGYRSLNPSLLSRVQKLRVGQSLRTNGYIIARSSRTRWRLQEGGPFGAWVMGGTPAQVVARAVGSRVNPARGIGAAPLKRDKWHAGRVRITKRGEIQFQT